MMNQLHHNFLKTNHLSIQITNLLHHFANGFYALQAENIMQCAIYKAQEKHWQSATYDGKVHIYNAKLISPNIASHNINLNDFTIKLNHIMREHDFMLSKSFVAEAKINNCTIIDENIIDIEIKALIIHEA